MKFLLHFTLLAGLVLLGTQCKVENALPVPTVFPAKNDADGKVTVFGTPRLKEQVRVLDVASAPNLKIVGKQLIVSGPLLFKSIPNGRRADLTLKIGDVVIMEPATTIPGGLQLIIDRLSGVTTDPNGGSDRITYDFHVLTDAQDIFSDFYAIFDVSANQPLNKTIQVAGETTISEREDPVTKTKYERRVSGKIDLTATGNLRISTVMALKIEQGRFVEASVVSKLVFSCKARFALEGKFTGEASEALIDHPTSFERTFVVYGIPIVVGIIPLNPKLKCSLELEGKVNTGDDFLDKELTATFYADVKSRSPGAEPTTFRNFRKEESGGTFKALKGEVKGSIKAGIEFSPSIYLYSNEFINVEGGLYLFSLITAEAHCNTGQNGVKITMTPGITPSLKFNFSFLKAVYGHDIGPAEVTFADVTPQTPAYERTFFYDTRCGYTSVDITNQPPVGQTVVPAYALALLKQHGMIINEGSSPGTMGTSTYKADGLLLVNSNKNPNEHGEQFGNLKLLFSQLTGNAFAFSTEITTGNSPKSQETARATYLTGSSSTGAFTVYADMNGQLEGVSATDLFYRNYVVVSGTRMPTGIDNLQYGFYRQELSGNYKDQFYPTGSVVVFNDPNGFSPKQ
ncbi:hypothetical protein [Fibrella forsythiae]|uniref:Lipoprotein n=1 Tax=Fibrella forsythiae TaxID=2817061 RepID=A0ABS3JLM7_9BACT|nr:hypothetical protein [Fibrella forsythiae]MBO0950296.1 hypothetical protein [Fibrella forsythiae]